jgi:hypothetical protein
MEGLIMRYIVDFYDAFDGWIRRGIEPEEEVQFDDLEKALQYRNKKNAELPDGNKKMGEHYGIIDTMLNREIQCVM